MTRAEILRPGTLSAQDRVDIVDLNARFAWALDLHDYDALHDLFTPDAHYVSVGREFHDRAALVESFRARTGERTTRHGLGNLQLTLLHDGSVAGRSSWHTFASHSEPPVGVGLYMVADFRDRYVEGDDGWRIAERIITPVFREASLAPGAS